MKDSACVSCSLLLILALLACDATDTAPQPSTVVPQSPAPVATARPAPARVGQKTQAPAFDAHYRRMMENGETELVRAKLEQAIVLHQEAENLRGQADCLALLGLTILSGPKPRDGLRHLEQSLELMQRLDDPLGAWTILLIMSQVERKTGHYAEAASHLERGLEQLEAMRRSAALLNLGSLELLGHLSGQSTGIVQLLKQSDLGPMAAVLKQLMLPILESMNRDALGIVLTQAGRLEEAEEQLRQALALSRQGLGVMDTQVQRHLGRLYRLQWRLDEARQQLRQAVAAVAIMPAPGERIGAYNELAEVEMLANRPDDAIAASQAALRIVRQQADPAREAVQLAQRGKLELVAGRYRQARQTFEQALGTARASGDNSAMAEVLGDFGWFAFFTGAYGEAVSYLEESVTRFKRERSNLQAAAISVTLSEVYHMLGKRDQAEQASQQALDLSLEVGFFSAADLARVTRAMSRVEDMDEVSGQLAGWIQNGLQDFGARQGGPLSQHEVEGLQSLLGLALTSVGMVGHEPSEGEIAQIREALSGIPLTEPSSPFAGMVQVFLGMVHLRAKDFDTAQSILEQAIANLGRVGQRDFEGLARALLGIVHWEAGRREKALEELRESIEQLEEVLNDVGVEELFASFAGDRNGLYQVLVGWLVDSGEPSEAFIYSERARARAFLRMLGNQRLHPYDGADQELLNQAHQLRTSISVINRQRQLHNLAKDGPLPAQQLEEARRRYETLLVKIKASNPEYASLLAIDPISLDQLQRVLPPDTTLISYFIIGNQRILAWVIDRDHCTPVTIDIEKEDLQGIRCFAIGLTTRPGSQEPTRGATLVSPCEAVPEAEELHDRLVGPLLPHVRHKNIVVVPHGVLHYLPFAALRDPDSGTYLVERHAITYLPSASALPFLQQKASPVDSGVLVLGNPDASLDGAEIEAQAVADLFGVSPLLGNEATEGQVRARAGTIDLLHLAAHGAFAAAAPRFSHIALAADAEHDGHLAVHELFSDLDLSGANLVVLSACRSGIGERSQGDEIVGLTRAFMYAGSPQVLSTLWNIDDAATAVLMTSFYGRLVDGATAAGALQAAQVELLHSPEHAEPYFWAAFTLHGDPAADWVQSQEPPETTRVAAASVR